MKAPHDPSDPLLRSLTEEAADLPVRAALAARQRSRQRRQNRQSIALAALAVLLGLFTWHLVPSRETLPIAAGAPPAAPASAAEAQPVIPSGLSQDQLSLVESARDLPLLLVRDASGKVSRIHIVER